MPLLGTGAVAMWWDMAPARRTEFEDWHSHEHLPERVGVPGLRRGSRWFDAMGGDGFFVLYEHESYETMTGSAYFARLNDPTPWSVKMMPHHRNMVRSQCRVAASCGGVIAGCMTTLRISPAPGQADALDDHLRLLLGRVPQHVGATGGHLLKTQASPAKPTKEQMIRGGADMAADWIVLLTGYALEALQELASSVFGAGPLVEAGALPTRTVSFHGLSHAMTPSDL